MKVLRREIEDALAVRDSTARQRNSREGQWLARQLFLRLFDVIGIEVDVAEGVDKFPGRETDFVSDQARQQSIRCDVERYAQKNVCRPLIELATQILVRDEELEKAVARRQGHLVDHSGVPGSEDVLATIRIGLEAGDNILEDRKSVG